MPTVLFRYLLVTLCLLATTPAATAQELTFEKDSLGQVLQRAARLQKPVFLLLTTSLPPSAAKLSRQEAERVYGTSLNDPAVVKALQPNFLVVRAFNNTPAGQRLARRYHVSTFPTYLYLHPDGTVLHRSFSNVRDPQRYLADIETFRQKLASPDNLSSLEKRYTRGERGAAFLRQYLQARRSVGAIVSPELLDEYVRELPVKAFDQFAEVVFVHEYGPVLNSRAYNVARLNKRLVDSLYTTLLLHRRVAINSAIITNSMQAAIASRDVQLATQTAGFASASWNASSNRQRASQAYGSNMLRYYKAVGDTARYLPLLMSHYEQHYMATPADTIRRQRTSKNPFTAPTPYTNLARPDSAVKMVSVFRSGGDVYAAELNNGAWEVYSSGTRRTAYLAQAMRWSQRTIDLDPRAGYYDTLAHLLYALHLNTEAEVTQQKAVAQAKKEGQPVAAYQEVLRKIKSRTL
ncbi:hypothetical protein CDA63_02900 [Hymenobacter amundsenii]|uniref:Thioredoxin domain-containing protein n=1 Tax=Hymenobacter amundsenii TaxID=2006685 RepID=A0A246FSJ4_9BACT|nr:hypothetical protein [Hymenobacter amundsenii]OWP64724.1 hypothetical protein CDA63_02900 [Hymenobacter amundsenii]